MEAKKNAGLSYLRQDFCLCNLQLDYCDVNCCCDQDCSLGDRLVFDHCEDYVHHYDTRLCDFTKTIYINNTPHDWHINHNSLFCVQSRSIPPTYIIQNKRIIQTIEDAEFQKSDQYSWPYLKRHFASFKNNSYSYGQTLWFLRNGTLNTLGVPKSVFSTTCLGLQKAKYLIQTKTTCLQTDIREENQYLSSQIYFENIDLIAIPQNFSLTLKNCSSKVCLKVTPWSCADYFENCRPFNKNLLNMECHFILSKNEYSCVNLVKDVQYVFYHNGTTGIVKAEVLLVHKNVTFSSFDITAFTQSFKINFKWINTSLNYSSYLSGNPGYIVGKPILIAERIIERIYSNITNDPQKNYFNETYNIFRDASDFRKNFMVLPENDQGLCVLNKHRYTSIEFGYNMYARCRLENSIVMSKNTSINSFCKSIQNTIFQYWSLTSINGSLGSKMIGQFGNANPNHRKDWSQVLFKTDLNDIFKQTSGQIDANNHSVTCSNITTLLSIEVYHSRIDFKTILNQEKILATTMRFHNFENVVVKYHPNLKQLNFSVLIETQVAFFDVTSEKKRKIVDPPTLNIKLPNDFFYPFVRVRNNGCSTRMFFRLCSIISIIFVLHLIVNCRVNLP